VKEFKSTLLTEFELQIDDLLKRNASFSSSNTKLEKEIKVLEQRVSELK
jgi:uncharacterized protein YeeX (DUF496 family)